MIFVSIQLLHIFFYSFFRRALFAFELSKLLITADIYIVFHQLKFHPIESIEQTHVGKILNRFAPLQLTIEKD